MNSVLGDLHRSSGERNDLFEGKALCSSVQCSGAEGLGVKNCSDSECRYFRRDQAHQKDKTTRHHINTKKTLLMSNPRDNFVSLITFLTIENNNLNIHGFASIKSDKDQHSQFLRC